MPISPAIQNRQREFRLRERGYRARLDDAEDDKEAEGDYKTC